MKPQYLWRLRQKAKAKAGQFFGRCDCGNIAVRFVGVDRVCARCDALERNEYAGVFASSVCGFVRRGQLASSSGRASK